VIFVQMAALTGLSASSGSTSANENIVRGEIVDRGGKPVLVATRRLRWGTQVVSEKPILLVEADPAIYLQASDADARLQKLAEEMGDASRLAAYVAFKQLHERKQKEFLALWREDIESSDPLARSIRVRNQAGVDAFVADSPEFCKLVHWHHFVMVASIFGRFGTVNPDGCRAVYALCSHIRHSCRPNAAWFTLKRGFPKGRKQLHIIAIDGIPRGEEITVTEADESVLVLSKEERLQRMFGTSGFTCECKRCLAGGAEEEDERISCALGRLRSLLDVRPPTDESTKEALQTLKELDKLLPFSMVLKAKAKVLLASTFGELSHRAAWQEESRGANVIQWTGLDASAQETRLKDTKKLYETAAKDFEYLLGQDALGILKRLEAGYGPVTDQHRILAKYTREKDSGPDRGQPQVAQQQPLPQPQQPQQGGYPPEAGVPQVSKEKLPPGWDELFRSQGQTVHLAT